MALVDDPLAGALQAKLKPLLEPDFVFAPYVPLQKIKLEDEAEVVVTEAVLETLPPSDDGSIQVGEGDGPAVLIPKVVEVRTKTPEFNPRVGLMSRYGQTAINPDFYKSILISTP
jgi:hypothetical protein